MLSIVLCETILKFSYMFFFKSLPLPLLTVRHIYEISEMTTHERRTIVTRPRSLMDFSLRCVCFYPGVNSRAELVTLAPGLRPGRRFAPLARGIFISPGRDPASFTENSPRGVTRLRHVNISPVNL